MWLTLCNIGMLQSVAPKITVSLELKTQILMDPNQTFWGDAARLDALSDIKNFRKNVHAGNAENMNLIFGPRFQNWPKNGIILLYLNEIVAQQCKIWHQ